MYKKEYLLERLQRAFTRKSIHVKHLPEKCESTRVQERGCEDF